MLRYAVAAAISLTCLLSPTVVAAASLFTESLSLGHSGDSGSQFTQTTEDETLPERLSLTKTYFDGGDNSFFSGIAQTTGGATLSSHVYSYFGVNCGSTNCSGGSTAIATINFDLGVLFTGSGTSTAAAVPVLFSYRLQTDLTQETISGSGIGGTNIQAEIDFNGSSGASLGPLVSAGETLLEDTLSVDLIPGETNTLSLTAAVSSGWDSLSPISGYTHLAEPLASVSVVLDPTFEFESDFELLIDPGAGVINPDFDPDLVPAIPIPAAVWLFGSGLVTLIGVGRRKE